MSESLCGALLLMVLIVSASPAPELHEQGKQLKLVAYSLDSRKTHLKFARNYVPLCEQKSSSYGMLDRQVPLSVRVLEPAVCRPACTQRLTAEDVGRYQWLIEHEYEQFYSLSPELPALYRNTNPSSDKLVSYDLGFPLGWLRDRTTYLVNNQIELQFNYRRREGKVEVLDIIVSEANCTSQPYLLQGNSTELTYYYSVSWKEEPEKVQVDLDLSAAERTRWIAIGFVVNIVYCLVIASVLYRNLLRDLKNCAKQIIGNSVQEFMELSEERSSGWKQHQREVFRPPQRRFVLAVLVGSGIQAALVVLLLLTRMAFHDYHYFALESEAMMGSFKWLLVCTSLAGGYAAARVYKMWGGHNWLGLSVATSVTLPLTLTLSLTVQNSMRLLQGALSYSVFQMFYIPLLWLLAAIPLGAAGAFVGFKRTAIRNPFSFHAVQQKRKLEFGLTKQVATGFVASLVPYLSFGAEYRVLLDSFWMSNPYDFYPLLLVAVLLLLFSCGLASLYTIYQSLNRGNPKWWGLPFASSFGLALCFTAAQILYLVLQVGMTRVTSIVIYFCWSLISVWLVFLCCGACSFVFAVFMVRRIYEMIKIE